MNSDHMAVISITSPIDLDDHYSIPEKKFFLEIPVVPLRGGEGRKIYLFFQDNGLCPFV